MYRAYGGFQLVEEHIFEQVALRARLERAVDVLVAVVGREHDDFAAENSAAYREMASTPPISGMRKSIKHDVGPVLAVERDGLAPVRALGDDAHVGHGVISDTKP